MDVLKIQGGCSLSGEVQVSGSKNACLPIFAATLLTDEPCIIENVPDLSDIRFMGDILKELGAEVSQIRSNTWKIQAKNINHCASYELVRKMRASVCLMGPLLGRLGKAKISLPGGCVIGQRPIDLHLKGFLKLGCEVSVENGYVHLNANSGLKGAPVFMGGRQGSTVTGTANILMAAVLTPGVTLIDSAACEPEVEDLCKMLIAMGAKIQGVGSHTLLIEGADRLKGCRYKIIGDRIEAGTFIIAGLMNENHITVRGVNSSHLSALLHQLEDAHITIDADDTIHVRGDPKALTPREIVTLPYPGFATDLQAQMTALMCFTPGISIITERIYPNRFMHVPELQRMGAEIFIEGHSAITRGQSTLTGTSVMASDLRASAALVLAGLTAHGETVIQRLYHIDRGYERIDAKLKALGAYVTRIPQEEVAGLELVPN